MERKRIKISEIHPDSMNRNINKDEVTKMAISMMLNGQRKPIIVVKTTKRRYKLVDGLIRIKALVLRNVTTVYAEIRDDYAADPRS
jgi:ParB-like chromosome segregation protein Spo0J